MSLRDEAIKAMYEADGERVGERVYVAKALDGLLWPTRMRSPKAVSYPHCLRVNGRLC